MRLTRAYSKHASATGQSAQMRWASWTPSPSLGKNMAGETSRHRPSLIHSASMGRSLRRDRAYPCVLRRKRFGLGFDRCPRRGTSRAAVTAPPEDERFQQAGRPPPPAPPGWILSAGPAQPPVAPVGAPGLPPGWVPVQPATFQPVASPPAPVPVVPSPPVPSWPAARVGGPSPPPGYWPAVRPPPGYPPGVAGSGLAPYGAPPAALYHQYRAPQPWYPVAPAVHQTLTKRNWLYLAVLTTVVGA